MNFPVHPLAFIEGIGGPEMMLILVIVLMLFGGQKLPELARGLGKSMKEFKKAAAGVEEEFKRALNEEEQRKTNAPVITSAQPVPALPEAAATASPLAGEPAPTETIAPSPVETTAVPLTPAPAPAAPPPPVTPDPVRTAPPPVAPTLRRGRADV
jgi:sec-independent protein translocase protein TatA